MSRALLLLAAAAIAGAGPAAAQTIGATYPKSRALSDVAAWISSDTPLQLAQIVDVGPSAVTAVTSATPTGEPRGFLANIASEAIDPAIGRQEDILSWRIPVEIDCEHRAVRLGDMTGFPSRDLKSAPRVVRQADTQWVQPTVSAPLGAVMKAMCDRDYKRPFASGTRLAAAKPPEPPARAKPQPPPGPPPEVVALNPPTKPQPLTAAIASNGPKAEEKPAAKGRAKAAPAETAEAAPPARPARALGHGSSPYAVQVGASPSQDDAKGLIGRVQKKFAGEVSGFKTDVMAATVDGKTVYRALISGFAGPGDANALCEQLKAAGQACFVRSKP